MKKLASVLILISIALTVASPALALSLIDGKNDQCIKDGNVTDPNCGLCSFIRIFVNAADIMVALSGVFLILMFIFGGFVMITAYGNESRVKWGKDALVAAVIGIFIVMLAWTLINTVIYSLYGVTGSGGDNAYNTFTGKNLTEWGKCAFPAKR